MTSWTWFSLLAVVAVVVYLLLHRRRRRAVARRVVEPVCGMTIDPARARVIRHGSAGAIYLCSESCAARFDADPARYGGVRPHHGAHLAC